MKIGLSNLLFVRSSVEDSVEKIAELGADCIEVVYDVPHFMPDHKPTQLGAIKGLIESYGLGVSVHGCFWDLNPASHYREIRDFSIKQTMRSIEACERLGGNLMVLHPGRIAITDVEWFAQSAKDYTMKFFDECEKFANDRGVKIAIENIGLPFFALSSLEELGEIVEGRENMGITLDIGHAYRRRKNMNVENPELEIAGLIRRLGRKIIHIHFHDNHGQSDEHLVPGEGSINFAPIVNALKEVKFGGAVVVEMFDPGNAVEAGRAGLQKTRELLQG